MPEWRRYGWWVATAVVVVLSLACGPFEPGALGRSAESWRYFYLVFDPTVLEAEDDGELRVVLDELRELYGSLPEGSEVRILIVGPQAATAVHAFSERYRWRSERGGRQDHEARLKGDFADKVEPLLREAWRRAHSPTGRRQLRSCLISTLFVVSEQLRALDASGSPPGGVQVVVVSDLLEACVDWAINLEHGVGALGPDRDWERIRETVDLSSVDGTWMVTLPSHAFRRPTEIVALQTWWSELLVALGVDESSIYVGRAFPSVTDLLVPGSSLRSPPARTAAAPATSTTPPGE